MYEALKEAANAYRIGEVPIGAVIVRGSEIIARAHNLREHQKDGTAHAELLAIRAAGAALGGWRLTGCTLYVTIEPCPMCAGALVQSRVDRLVYGASDPKAWGDLSIQDLIQNERINHRLPWTSGIAADPCSQIMKRFFASRRKG